MSLSSTIRFRLSLLLFMGLFSCGQSMAVIDGREAAERNLERLEPQEAYRQTVHALLRTQACIGCHVQGGQGSGPFADEDVAVAFSAALRMPLFNTSNVAESKIVRKLKTLHNCGGPEKCDALIERIQAEVTRFTQATVKDEFQVTRLETAAVKWSEVPLQQANTAMPLKTLMFSLVPPLPKDPDVNPRFELTLTRVPRADGGGEELWSASNPRIHINGNANILVKKVMVLINGSEAAKTLNSIDARVVGPTVQTPASLLSGQSGGAALTFNSDDSVQLAFELLEFVR